MVSNEFLYCFFSYCFVFLFLVVGREVVFHELALYLRNERPRNGAGGHRGHP